MGLISAICLVPRLVASALVPCHSLGLGSALGAHTALQGLLLSPTLPERDLPDPLDQKIITWETVQKENFLSAMERRRRDSEGEMLRKTAHRWGDLWDSREQACEAQAGRCHHACSWAAQRCREGPTWRQVDSNAVGLG